MVDGGPRERLKPRPVTAARLEAAALRYLERFAASAASLRRVLLARVDRSVREHGTERADGVAWIEALICRYQRSGLLNDAVYAEGRASSLRRRGASTRAIQNHLATRGVAPEVVQAAVERADGDWCLDQDGSPDLLAAKALAKRRRLGPFRPEDQRPANRARDLATLGRAGFSYETARRVIDGDET